MKPTPKEAHQSRVILQLDAEIAALRLEVGLEQNKTGSWIFASTVLLLIHLFVLIGFLAGSGGFTEWVSSVGGEVVRAVSWLFSFRGNP